MDAGGPGHVFAPGATLGPGALLVLTNAADPAVFRSAHAVPPEAQVLAASFKLDNSGEALTLTQPNSDPARPAIVVERVRYNNKAPWPVEAAGAGFSLERIAPAHYGNEPLNWHCGTPGGSPGRRPSAATSTVIARGGEWRFHATGRDLGAAWRGPAYRDNAWPAGRSPLGFGAAVATALPYATAPRPLVTWLRKEFAVADPPDAIATLTAAIDFPCRGNPGHGGGRLPWKMIMPPGSVASIGCPSAFDAESVARPCGSQRFLKWIFYY